MTTDSTTCAIELRGLEKSFKDLRVLRGVDLRVGQGSIFTLLGSNGAGKTTLVKILATLLRGDAGTVRVHGFDVATQAAKVRESFSLTGQFAAVDEILTGRENLILVAQLRHLADELVDLLDAVFLDMMPIAHQLLGLLGERGWTGWTRLERVNPARSPSNITG